MCSIEPLSFATLAASEADAAVQLAGRHPVVQDAGRRRGDQLPHGEHPRASLPKWLWQFSFLRFGCPTGLDEHFPIDCVTCFYASLGSSGDLCSSICLPFESLLGSRRLLTVVFGQWYVANAAAVTCDWSQMVRMSAVGRTRTSCWRSGCGRASRTGGYRCWSRK